MKYIASVSFGKDSLAMLLRLIEEKWPLDEVIFYNTGMEFQCIYKIRDIIKNLLKEKDISFTELKPKCSFCYQMFEKPVKLGKTNEHYGYSWCGGRCRWGTTEKLNTIKRYLKQYDNVCEYVGIAIDETKRINKERTGNKVFPLVEWEMTEKDCLEYCYIRGYFWQEDNVELYNILDRVSCWCCSNKNLKELENYYKFLPKYWHMLKTLQSKTTRPFYHNKYTIFELEEKFKKKL